MPRKPSGTVYAENGKWFARITLSAGTKGRRAFGLVTCRTEEEAEARKVVLADVAVKLRDAGVDIDLAGQTLGLLASSDAAALADALVAADMIARRGAAPAHKVETFGSISSAWVSGELSRRYPEHIPPKRSFETDGYYLRKHILPIVRDVPIGSFTLDDAERVMSSLAKPLEPSTRRQIGVCMQRVLSISVFPLRLLATNPLPRNFFPRVKKKKARGFLEPADDRALLSCARVHVAWRVAYGLLAREGPRFVEAAALDVGDVDLDRGVVNLDQNKTADPRSWSLDPGTVAALRGWFAWREKHLGRPLRADEPLLTGPEGKRLGDSEAHRFRDHLKLAGVTRAELYTRDALRSPIRVHDLRATMITLAMAAGRTESWITDRTGHKSSAQLYGYKRNARGAVERHLGWLDPMNEAIPEFSPAGSVSGNVSGERGGGASKREKKGDSRSAARSIWSSGEDDTSHREPTISVHGASGSLPLGPPLTIPEPLAAASTPRAVAVAALLEQARAAALAGDTSTAAILTETAGRLLADPAVTASSSDVIDLDRERRRRGA